MKNATHFIVFDIERNFRPYKSEDPSEIVDIGAVKIDVSTMKVIGEFSELVKPSAPLTRHTTKLTGITKKDLTRCREFPSNYREIYSVHRRRFNICFMGKRRLPFSISRLYIIRCRMPMYGKRE